MHMSDALISPAAASVFYSASAIAAGVSVYKVKKDADPKKVPVMGVMGAFVFATQMINFTIPGTGSSGHLCGGVLLAALLGPYAAFLAMIGVLLIQCLLFADGGLLALGCNVWNMSFYGCFLGSLIFSLFNKKSMSRGKIVAASLSACVVTLQLGAFSVVLETVFSGITGIPFGVFVLTMQPIHLAIGAVEGLITSAVLLFVYSARPELLYNYNALENRETGKGLSVRKTLIILMIATAVIACFVSLFASAYPDGLEWSLEKVAGTAELEAAGSAYETSEKIQSATSLLPDYGFRNSESAAGTTVSGIVGSAIVFGFLLLIGFLFRNFKRKEYK